jgi:glycosyltransferase involved in cell wall biosynthesis
VIIGFDNQIFGLQPWGGISRYFVELGRALQGLGETVTCAAGLHLSAYLGDPGFQVSGCRLERYPRALANKLRLLNTRYSDFSLRRRGVEVLHQTYYRPGAHAVGPVPVIVTVHDLIHEIFPREYSPGDPVAKNRRIAIERADHVICVSRGTQRDLVEHLGVPLARTSVVYHGISGLPVRAPVDGEPVAAEPRRPYLLHVGSRQGYKNFMGLLRAYASSPRLRASVRVVAVGGGPPRAEELELLGGAGLSSGDTDADVSFLSGGDELLGALLHGALSLVYPSRYEGFGMPPLEAMQAGCPVTCSRASVMPEILGEAPHYFDPDEPDDIRRALEEVVFSDALRARLSAEGRRRAARYSWTRCAEETLAVYRAALSGRAGAPGARGGRA